MQRHILFLILLFPLACDSPHSDNNRKTTPQDAELEKFIEQVVLKAEDTGQAEKAYHKLFSIAGTDGIYPLKFHPNDNISLHAAWEEARLTILRNEKNRDADSITHQALQRFVGFLEGRLRTSMPNWWENGFRRVETSEPGDVHPLVAQAQDLYCYHKTGAGYSASPNTVVVGPTEKPVLTIGSESVSIPPRILERKRALGGVGGISAAVDDHYWYITFHSSVPYSHNLVCIEKKSGKVLWNNSVWGEGIAGYEGGGHFHLVQVVPQAQRVLVFGGGAGFLYLQAFNKSDGKSLFRFWTRKVPRAPDKGEDVPK
jgi:hypothetical protein